MTEVCHRPPPAALTRVLDRFIEVPAPGRLPVRGACRGQLGFTVTLSKTPVLIEGSGELCLRPDHGGDGGTVEGLGYVSGEGEAAGGQQGIGLSDGESDGELATGMSCRSYRRQHLTMCGQPLSDPGRPW